MAVEIEAKMKVANLDEVRDKLKSLGAEDAGKFIEVNAFFDTKDRSLLAADQGLRLRVNRCASSGKETYTYTFKGPRLHGKLKTRDEIELDVANARDAERFLTALGYEKVLSFEKRRHKWKLKGCSVELDELPYLGTFVEVEGPDEKTVMAACESLALVDAPMIKTSYTALLMSHLQEKGTGTSRTVTFPA